MKKTYKLVDSRYDSVIARNLSKKEVNNILLEYGNLVLCEDNPLPFLEVVKEEPIHVIFRIDKKDNNEVVAFFPYQAYVSPSLEFGCYGHVGQHSTSSFSYYKQTKPATFEQYKDLKDELENLIGYDLKIVKKINSNKYQTAFINLLSKMK